MANTKSIAIDVQINENFTFPTDGLEKLEALHLDLSKVNLINSEGTRRLSNWVWEMEKSRPSLAIEMDRVSPVVTRQLGMISIQKAGNVEVRSVYVPFYCDSCDRDDLSTLVTKDQVKKGGKDLQLKPVTCKECGKPMEIDVGKEYFLVFK